jgi:hypothetical protein
MLTATFISAGLALVFSCVFAMLACHLGILFTGIATFFAVVGATGFCAIDK